MPNEHNSAQKTKNGRDADDGEDKVMNMRKLSLRRPRLARQEQEPPGHLVDWVLFFLFVAAGD